MTTSAPIHATTADAAWCALARDARAVSRYLDPQNEETVICDGDLGWLEHAIHELSHAELLGIEPRPDMATAISEALGPMDYLDQIGEEAKAWAIEWEVWKRLGMTAPSGPLAWGDALAGAETQGVPNEMLERLAASPRWRSRARRVIAALRECASVVSG